MFVIGIDPGARGAVAILERGGKLVHVFEMPAVEVMVGGKLKRRVSMSRRVPMSLAKHHRKPCRPCICGAV